jgi:hypothetical protein
MKKGAVAAVVIQTLWVRVWVILLCWGYLVSLSSCSTVKSVVPGLGGDSAAGDRQHFPVPPEEAVEILREVAPQKGWEVVSSGDEFDINGPRGKYFRLEAERTIGSKRVVSGVFFSEPSGSYVTISNKVGLPEDLLEPLRTAIKGRTGMTGEDP